MTLVETEKQLGDAVRRRAEKHFREDYNKITHPLAPKGASVMTCPHCGVRIYFFLPQEVI